VGADRAAAGGEGGEAKATHDGSQNLIIYFVTFEASHGQGGYKEMSSILADQQRPSYMGGGGAGSQPMRTAVQIT
jgi:hypothetical protein